MSATGLVDQYGQPLTAGIHPVLEDWFKRLARFMTREKVGMHCNVCRSVIKETATCWRHVDACPGPPADDVKDTAAGIVVEKIPNGGFRWPGVPPPKHELPAREMEWFRQFGDVGPNLRYGLHCDKCQADIVGMDDDHDTVYAVTCGCREWIGPNRDARPVPPLTMN